ncbi:MAG: enoyl-CoA hydratase/isomerase family protein [Deltaproteobacteria bacterium]|nr:enoyl-CoA hydratase/isomerase family protein [Deltaproteobacteria bacterium]MBW1847209.1 enoyl-CoA hydratase/isomerase family protein [Deltaproteobacteria bacterium]MBW1983483.1 enoyl-CoA hydratase/isomerase family protein [Deltaproteobacteria bacterium]MBW2179497.1 enoyl-CoA hydratase/isomerase family protein [Deltaproteobacteria bacterium]
MPPLIYEKKNGIAYLTLNRPEAHNAIDPEMILELAAAWEDYRDDNSMRCAILTGAGEKTFCSGADLAKLIPLYSGAKKPESDADKKVHSDLTLGQRALLREFELHKPIIAAVNGDAIAGGFEFLYATDIRVASENARFGLQEVKWAIFPMGGSSVRLPQQMPYARAMEILLTGELMSAAEAHKYGFLNRVVPASQVMEEAEKFASILAKNGPLAISAIKKAVLSNIGLTLSQGLANELEHALPVFMSEDVKEGPRAFKEKREPKYKGR